MYACCFYASHAMTLTQEIRYLYLSKTIQMENNSNFVIPDSYTDGDAKGCII